MSVSEDDLVFDADMVVHLPRFLESWDLDERRSLKAFHQRLKKLKESVNKTDVTAHLQDVPSGSWITVLPCGRVYATNRSCDARRIGSSSDVSYIFILE